MGNHLTSMQREEQRRKAVEALRTNRIGALLQIIDELDDMRLSAQEISAVLSECGLNYNCAMRVGAEIQGHRESGKVEGLKR